MRKLKWLFALSMPVLMISCQKEIANNPSNDEVVSAVSETGNGGPSGAHYQLNIIGIPKNKTADMTNNDGRRIFVNLDGKSNIYLTEGDFAVLDANGTDGNGARFQLPVPDADCDGNTEYSVFARALGKPGGNATIVNCAEYWDGDSWENICETDLNEILNVERTTGQSKFTNVTRQLLYIYVDIGSGLKRYQIFDDRLRNYYWEYDNNGLKVLQLRFYQVSTSVEVDCPQ